MQRGQPQRGQPCRRGCRAGTRRPLPSRFIEPRRGDRGRFAKPNWVTIHISSSRSVGVLALAGQRRVQQSRVDQWMAFGIPRYADADHAMLDQPARVENVEGVLEDAARAFAVAGDEHEFRHGRLGKTPQPVVQFRRVRHEPCGQVRNRNHPAGVNAFAGPHRILPVGTWNERDVDACAKRQIVGQVRRCGHLARREFNGRAANQLAHGVGNAVDRRGDVRLG